MPFIPGKLKPRIKPRIGARVSGVVESVDQLKSKPEDQNTSVELLVPKPCGSPSVVATTASQDHQSQTPTSDEIRSGLESPSTDINKDQAPSNFWDLDKKNELSSQLEKPDQVISHGGSFANCECEKAGEEAVVKPSSLIAEKSSSEKNSKRLSSHVPTDQSPESSKEKVELVSGQPLEAALVEGNICNEDKRPRQFTVIQTIAAETPPVDDSQKSLESSSVEVESSSVQKRNLKNIRQIGLKFHKPNLKRFARSQTTSSISPLPDQLVLSINATPESSLVAGPIRTEVEDQECPKTSGEQPNVFGGNAKAATQVNVSSSLCGSETSEECSASSCRIGVTSDVPSEELISIEKSSTVSDIPSDIAGDTVSDSSQIIDSMQPSESICDADNFKSATNIVNQVVFKKPPKVSKRVPIMKHDRVKPKVDTQKTTTGESESESMKSRNVATASLANTDAENVTDEAVPIIDTTIERNSSYSSPLSTVNVNTKNASSTDTEKKDVSGSDSRVLVKSTVVPKAAPVLKTAKSAKGEADDVRVMFAISAVDYLKRHDHALGDSILRRLIIGDKNMESRSRKSTMCSTCNPQTLKKCLTSLWSFDKSELQTIVNKAAERHKTHVAHSSLPGKPLFKPSLGRQRAPTLTASTYGKMSFDVKERLAKQYGANPPQLNKLRMLDLIFYNPSDNPMSQPAKQPEQKPRSENNLDVRKSEACKADSPKVCDADSDPDDPVEEKDVKRSSDARRATCEPAVPVPQVRIGDEGQIILAAESLVVKKKEPEVMNSPVVEEFSFSDSNRKKASFDRTTWSFEETLQFYKALHSLGTDFSMMNEMFPKRTRANLKSKFKREERKNSALIDKVLAAQGQTLNLSDVEKDLTADKTLRRLGLDCTRTCRKNPLKKSWQQRAAREAAGFDPRGAEYPSNLSCLSRVASEVMKNSSRSEGVEGQSTSSKNSDEELGVTSLGTSEKDDAIFKRPSNIRPPRKRKPVESTSALPDKRKKVESPSGKESKETTDKGEDAVFKKPRIPKKRRLPQQSKRPISPEPVQHILSISLNDEEEESDDTDDSASLDGADDDCLIIKTDIKGDNYSYSRSVRVHIADPEVPIEWNETIEHDRPQTPMSDSMSETDVELGFDSEGGEEVEVVSIDVNEIASYLEKTGAVVIESSQRNETNVEDLPVTVDHIAEDSPPAVDGAVAENLLPTSPH